MRISLLFNPLPSQPSAVINHWSFFVSSPTGKSYRQEQCELRNGPQTDPKGVKTFVEWVPKYAGVLPKDVCKLTCRAKGTGYYVVFSQRVRSKKLLSARDEQVQGDVNRRLSAPYRWWTGPSVGRTAARCA